MSCSSPNFKVCCPDEIPIKFFKTLIPGKDNSEEASENNNNSLYLYLLENKYKYL